MQVIDSQASTLVLEGSTDISGEELDDLLAKAYSEAEHMSLQYNLWLRIMIKHKYSAQAEAEIRLQAQRLHEIMGDIQANFGASSLPGAEVESLQAQVKKAAEEHTDLKENIHKFLPRDGDLALEVESLRDLKGEDDQLAKRLRSI